MFNCYSIWIGLVKKYDLFLFILVILSLVVFQLWHHRYYYIHITYRIVNSLFQSIYSFRITEKNLHQNICYCGSSFKLYEQNIVVCFSDSCFSCELKCCEHLHAIRRSDFCRMMLLHKHLFQCFSSNFDKK